MKFIWLVVTRGVEEYLAVPGVLMPYQLQWKGETTKYELVPQTGHAETVHITYNVKKVSLKELLLHYFRIIIDPTSKNRQGNDCGLTTEQVSIMPSRRPSNY